MRAGTVPRVRPYSPKNIPKGSRMARTPAKQKAAAPNPAAKAPVMAKPAAKKAAAKKAPAKAAAPAPARNFAINTLVKHGSGTHLTRTHVEGKAIIPPHTHDTDFVIIPHNDHNGKRVYHRGDKVVREEPLVGKKGVPYLVKAPRAGERISIHNLSSKPMMFDKIIMPNKPTKPAKPTKPTTKPAPKPKAPKKAK
jgi:hypothetical protein